MTKSDEALIIPIPVKDEQKWDDFIEIQGKNQLKKRQDQFFGLSSDQCVILEKILIILLYGTVLVEFWIFFLIREMKIEIWLFCKIILLKGVAGYALGFQDRDRTCWSNECNKSVLKASQTHHY